LARIARPFGADDQQGGILFTAADDDDDDELDDEETGTDVLVPERMAEPFTFCGLDTVLDYRGRPCVDSDGRPLGVAPRYLDARGHSFGTLDLYRYRQYREYECDDPDVTERVDAVLDRQMREQGVRYDDDRDRWVQD